MHRNASPVHCCKHSNHSMSHAATEPRDARSVWLVFDGRIAGKRAIGRGIADDHTVIPIASGGIAVGDRGGVAIESPQPGQLVLDITSERDVADLVAPIGAYGNRNDADTCIRGFFYPAVAISAARIHVAIHGIVAGGGVRISIIAVRGPIADIRSNGEIWHHGISSACWPSWPE